MIAIYHNPRCSKSRAALGLIRQAGIEPEVVLYVKTPPTREKLQELIASMGVAPRDILRSGDALCDDLGLGDENLSDDAILEAMAAHPKLINRPIVETPLGVKLCRPPEQVLELLPSSKQAVQSND